jgi:hypothetical protein
MSIPRSADLASDVLTHTYDDLFNPPGLTNFLGTAQIDLDVFAIRSVNFPPYSHGITGQLYVDGRSARSYGGEVDVVWRPDQVVRATSVDGLSLRSTTACVPGRPAVVVQLDVEGAPGRFVRLGLALASTASRSAIGWSRPEQPPSEENTLTAVDGRVLSIGESGSAVSLQGFDVPAEVSGSMLEATVELDASGRGRLGFVHVLAGDLAEATEHFDACVADVPAVFDAAEEAWDKALADAFDADGDGGRD